MLRPRVLRNPGPPRRLRPLVITIRCLALYSSSRRRPGSISAVDLGLRRDDDMMGWYPLGSKPDRTEDAPTELKCLFSDGIPDSLKPYSFAPAQAGSSQGRCSSGIWVAS